jgi:hypothetical protein
VARPVLNPADDRRISRHQSRLREVLTMKRIVALLLLAFSFSAFAADPPADKPADAKADKKTKAKKGAKKDDAKKDDTKKDDGAKTE